jgi:heavy metal sensor kinase
VKALPLRVRLTAWYFAVLASSLLLISVAALFAMSRSIHGAVDEELRARVVVIRKLMDRKLRSSSLEDLQREFREHSGLRPGGDLTQVADASGNWIFRSRSMVRYDVPLPGDRNNPPANWTAYFNGMPLRIHAEVASINGQNYLIQVAAPMDDFKEAVVHFRRFLLLAVPFVLLIATAGGYFLSRRALRPVDEIMDAAQKIGAQNLSNRLSVPNTGDELQRLSETLNGMLERIEVAFRKISQFTADASHELRTPLAIMRTRAELTLRKPRAAAEYSEELHQILSDLERTSDLVERLMLLARADSGAPVLQFGNIDLADVLAKSAEQATTLATAKHIDFSAELATPGVMVRGDAQFLQRLFLILLDNAVKYTPQGGEIAISCGKTTDSAVVSVRDNGVGIPEADLPNIFERFYRADKARSRESGGTGLGLAIAHWIVEAHQGTIDVTSVSGKGSTFRIMLPVAKSAAPANEKSTAAAHV